MNFTLTNDYNDAISDCELAYKTIYDLENRLQEKTASENVEQKQKEVDEVKQEKSNLDDNLEATKNKLKTSQNVLKNKEREVENLKEENATVTAKLIEVETDFANFTLKLKTENRKKKKVDMKNYECDECEVKTGTLQKLIAHKKITHMMTKAAQTELNDVEDKIVQVYRTEFECDKSEQTSDEQTLDTNIVTEETFLKYPCCYCGTMIANEYHLGEHIERCRGTFNMFTEPGLPMLPFKSSPRFPPSWPPPLNMDFSGLINI